MRILSACRIYRSVLKNTIICILLMLLLMNYLQEPKSKTPTVNLDVKADVSTRALNALSDEEMKAFNALSYEQMKALNTPGCEERRVDTKALNAIHEVAKTLSSSSEKERIETLYKMADTLMNATDEKTMNLEQIVHHLRILRTRTFSKTMRPDTCHGCMAYNFKNMINPTHICQREEDIKLFIIITTIPKEYIERAIVRKTWASLTAKNTASVRHLFLFGGGFSEKDQRIIDKESSKYGDILQEDFIDNYYNLSYKAIMGYKWVTENCPGARFIMRTACDNFINIPLVMELLQKENQTIAGHHMDFAQLGTKIKDLKVLRSPKRKWYITEHELNTTWEMYPDYCIGTAFVFHRKAAIKFLKASANVPFFVIEDAYFGMVMKTIDMPAANIPGFTIEADQIGLPRRRGCPNKGQWYSIHLATPDIIHQLWKSCEKYWTLPQHLI